MEKIQAQQQHDTGIKNDQQSSHVAGVVKNMFSVVRFPLSLHASGPLDYSVFRKIKAK